MNLKPLGSTGMSVSPLCFGGNVFGWTLDEQQSFNLLDELADIGWNFIDTADMYSRWSPGNVGGESEQILGKWFARSGKRDQVILTSKVGMDMGEDPSGEPRKGLKSSYIVQAVEDSLRRLQTDRIDLYQAHQDDPDTPQQETLEAFSRLVSAGKVRALGASNFSADRLTSALAVSDAAGLARYQTLQPLYSLMERDAFEAQLQPLCVQQGIGVLPYYSLASGFLSGKYRSPEDAAKSARGPGIIDKYLNARGLRVLAALDTLAKQFNCSVGAISIAWLMSRPAITAPIVSATSRAQLDELITATSLTLTPAAIALLDQASQSD